MNLLIDGRAIELDESVDRVVIEKTRDGQVTVSSHFGIKRQEIAAPKRQVVDHTAYVHSAQVKSPASNGTALKGNKIVGNLSVRCPKCETMNHPRQKLCVAGCGHNLRYRSTV